MLASLILGTLRDAEFRGFHSVDQFWQSPQGRPQPSTVKFKSFPIVALRAIVASDDFSATMAEAERRGLLTRSVMRVWPFAPHMNMILPDQRGLFIQTTRGHDLISMRAVVGTAVVGKAELRKAYECTDTVTEAAGFKTAMISGAGLAMLDAETGDTRPGNRRDKYRGILGDAILLVRESPEKSDADIAEAVGCSPAFLSKSADYQNVARLARDCRTPKRRVKHGGKNTRIDVSE